MEALRIRDVLEDREIFKRADPHSLLTFIGNTLLIQIRQMTRHLKRVQIFAKAQWLNPGGSVKDRAALKII
jgi:cysteine synthase